MKHPKSSFSFPCRFYLILFVIIVLVGFLVSRLVVLTIVHRDFLLKQGDARTIRIVDIPAYRGMIVDRNGEPLAVSTAVYSIWINPQDFPNQKKAIERIGRLLHLSTGHLQQLLADHQDRQFVYLKQGIEPDLAKQVEQMDVPGIYLEKKYRRYYPLGEVAAQVVGFTDIDEHGLEGLELLYDAWLRGESGREKIIKDLLGHKVAVLSTIKQAKSGKDLILSLDNRIQFLTYRVLQDTLNQYQAKSGSAIVLDVKSGEILAMVNQPSYNPNLRSSRDYESFRNRSVTDMFEPGSTLKVFSISAALESGRYQPESLVNTSPGWMKIGHEKVQDAENMNHGILSVTQVLQKSSNVGIAKLILSLPPQNFLDLLHRVGLGERTASGFPGEGLGTINREALTMPFVLATVSFGYGIMVTPLQLIAAYSVIAAGGMKYPVTFLKQSQPSVGERVLSEKVSRQVLHMLETVVTREGTGQRAKVFRYRVAGKTGTSYIAGDHGYEKERYVSSFVGIAPVSQPRIVVAVIVREPRQKYYGGIVAAPAFARIMEGSLDILNIAPDAQEK